MRAVPEHSANFRVRRHGFLGDAPLLQQYDFVENLDPLNLKTVVTQTTGLVLMLLLAGVVVVVAAAGVLLEALTYQIDCRVVRGPHDLVRRAFGEGCGRPIVLHGLRGGLHPIEGTDRSSTSPHRHNRNGHHSGNCVGPISSYFA